MEDIKEKLVIEPEQVCHQITNLLSEKLEALGKDGMLIGLSGGFDSAVVAYLAERSVGAGKLTLLNMPDRDSKRKHRQHAELIAKELGQPLKVQSLTPALRAAGVYRSLPIGLVPGERLKRSLVEWGRKASGLEASENLLAERLHPKADSLVARGNAYATFKHRMRMVFLYHHAQIHNLMVVGAANKTELLTGTFSQWGCDQCADVMPIVHLYRSQLSPLAEYLGLPEVVRKKAADPDVLPGVDDKGELLGSFELADQILWGLEHGIPEERLIDSFGQELFLRIKTLYELSRPMREVPYMLD
ncbi:MAG: NAD(+) synthase [Anaerolineae bacterium]|nr:NAD(+) synthase [Anaerolineae bacterium]